MSTTASRPGGSVPIRLAVPPAVAPAIWTAAVVAAGAALGGHVPAARLLALAVVAGLPHGAGDWDRGRDAFGRGAGGWLSFLGFYLGLVGIALTAWAVVPAPAMAVFLILSAVHFGTQDAGHGPGAPSPAAVLAHGGAVIVVPAVAYPDQVRDLFATVIGGRADGLQALLAGPVAAIWLGCVLLVAFDVANGRRSWPALGDLLLVCLLFVVAPPLVAFAFYFALLHTPRALRDQHGRGDAAAVTPRLLGVTALACLLGVAIFLSGPRLALDDGIVRTSFVLLSALTLPHMALDMLARGRLAR